MVAQGSVQSVRRPDQHLNAAGSARHISEKQGYVKSHMAFGAFVEQAALRSGALQHKYRRSRGANRIASRPIANTWWGKNKRRIGFQPDGLPFRWEMRQSLHGLAQTTIIGPATCLGRPAHGIAASPRRRLLIGRSVAVCEPYVGTLGRGEYRALAQLLPSAPSRCRPPRPTRFAARRLLQRRHIGGRRRALDVSRASSPQAPKRSPGSQQTGRITRPFPAARASPQTIPKSSCPARIGVLVTESRIIRQRPNGRNMQQAPNQIDPSSPLHTRLC